MQLKISNNENKIIIIQVENKVIKEVKIKRIKRIEEIEKLMFDLYAVKSGIFPITLWA